MQNRKFTQNEFISTILNHRVCNQEVSKILNLSNKVQEQHIVVSIYLENGNGHTKLKAEQWIFGFDLNVQCSPFCIHESIPLCCLMEKSPLYQNFILKQQYHRQYSLQTSIEHDFKNQNLGLYKCYHLKISDNFIIIARFHQHLNLSLEPIKKRSISFESQQLTPVQNRLHRFLSEEVDQKKKDPKVFMYSFEEDVTFLIEEGQVESLINKNSDSDYFIQTIDEETDVTEWQVIDSKPVLSEHTKNILNQLQDLKSNFNLKHRHSHQIKACLQFNL